MGILLRSITILLMAGAVTYGGPRNSSPARVKNQEPPTRLSVTPAPGTRMDLSKHPARLYAETDGESQVPPRIILKIAGLRAGATVYWAYQYRKGPHNPGGQLASNPFSQRQGHPFDPWLDSTIATQKGESEVFFTPTTYAGDTFQFAVCIKEYTASFKNESHMSIRFRNAITKSDSMVVWKRLLHESPKVLRNVRFSETMWDHIIANLDALNIELVGPKEPTIISPADPTISHYFYTRKGDTQRGTGEDPRYGPHGYGTRERMLSRINMLFGDGDSATVNIFLLGATSPNRDLIRNSDGERPTPPYPVAHNHRYSDREIDLGEWSAFGTGLSLGGEHPAIFIWADFWWLAGEIIHVSYDKALARVFLHESGHHLLMFGRGGDGDILDATGHLSPFLAHGRSMMTGSSIRQINRRGKVVLSLESKRLERAFIENPVWHPRVETLIRRDYRPRQRTRR